MISHPLTNEAIWFNGAHTNHRSYYDLAPHVDTTEGSPMTTGFGDGTEFGDEVLEEIRQAMWRHAVAVKLKRGDVVLVDNHLTGHGRMPWWEGERRMILTHFLRAGAAED